MTARQAASEEAGAASASPPAGCQRGEAEAPVHHWQAGQSGHTLMAFTEHAPSPPALLSPSGDSLWKRNPSTWAFQAVISSFIFQFSSRSLSASSLLPPQRSGEEERRVTASTPLPGAPRGRELAESPAGEEGGVGPQVTLCNLWTLLGAAGPSLRAFRTARHSPGPSKALPTASACQTGTLPLPCRQRTHFPCQFLGMEVCRRNSLHPAPLLPTLQISL